MCSLREIMCSLTCVGVGNSERPIASIAPMLTEGFQRRLVERLGRVD